MCSRCFAAEHILVLHRRSVGCVVIELLEGQPPYHTLEPMQALFRIVQDDSPPIPEGASGVSSSCSTDQLRDVDGFSYSSDGQRLHVSVFPEGSQSTNHRAEVGKASLDVGLQTPNRVHSTARTICSAPSGRGLTTQSSGDRIGRYKPDCFADRQEIEAGHHKEETLRPNPGIHLARALSWTAFDQFPVITHTRSLGHGESYH